MKTIRQYASVTLAILAISAMPAVATAEDNRKVALAYEDENNAKEVLIGTVKEKGDKEVTVTRTRDQLDYKVTLTDTTLYLKAGLPVTVNEVVVGGRVKVKLKKDTQEALEVRIYGDKEEDKP
jgi:hypothetical protein